jgi:hypothetical protein
MFRSALVYHLDVESLRPFAAYVRDEAVKTADEVYLPEQEGVAVLESLEQGHAGWKWGRLKVLLQVDEDADSVQLDLYTPAKIFWEPFYINSDDESPPPASDLEASELSICVNGSDVRVFDFSKLMTLVGTSTASRCVSAWHWALLLDGAWIYTFINTSICA